MVNFGFKKVEHGMVQYICRTLLTPTGKVFGKEGRKVGSVVCVLDLGGDRVRCGTVDSLIAMADGRVR